MSTQELLTYLFDAIAISFISVALFDFTIRATALYSQISANPTPAKLGSTTTQLPQIPDPWLLPISAGTSVESPIKLVHKEQPPAKEMNVSSPEPKLEDLLQGVDLDKLKLRPARKIAKVLEIAQKVNGKDQNLTFLRNQIKLKLQQQRTLLPEVVVAVKAELIAC